MKNIPDQHSKMNRDRKMAFLKDLANRHFDAMENDLLKTFPGSEDEVDQLIHVYLLGREAFHAKVVASFPVHKL